uniref:Minor capsid protein P9 transmembrane helices domain-containing protein n=1 Tax=Florenciella sp. virus SA2 TaxID=3240092 RepID=A0AB39J8H3_9VIRU
MEDEFWINDPKILLNKEKLLEFWPYSKLSYNNKLNSITRFVILITLFGYVIFNNYIVLLIGVIVICFIVFIHNYYSIEAFENFLNPDFDENINSATNPLSNMLVNDPPIKPEIKVEYDEKMENNINNKTKQFILDNNKNNSDIGEIFKTLADNLNFETSMRQFYINPNTTNPNNQDDFVKYCYNDLYSEKPLVIY